MQTCFALIPFCLTPGHFEYKNKLIMSYNTVSQFKLYAFPSGSFNSIPDAVIQNALDDATAEIDSALRKHHTLPMNTGSYSSELAVLYNTERVIAGYTLLLWKGFKPNPDNVQDVVLTNMFESAKGTVDKIREGLIIFPQESDATPTDTENRPRMFGKSTRTIRYLDDDDVEWV